MSDDLNRQIFEEEAQELLGELESGLLELEQEPDDFDLINRIFRALHTIKGSGAMFGFDAIAAFTHEVETVFDLVRGGSVPVTKELLNCVLRSRDQVLVMLTDPAHADEAVGRTILRDLESAACSGDSAVDCALVGVGESGEPDAETDVGEVDTGAAPDANACELYVIMFQQAAPPTPEQVEELADGLAKLGSCAMCRMEGDEPGWVARLFTTSDRDAVEDVFFLTDAALDVHVLGPDEWEAVRPEGVDFEAASPVGTGDAAPPEAETAAASGAGIEDLPLIDEMAAPAETGDAERGELPDALVEPAKAEPPSAIPAPAPTPPKWPEPAGREATPPKQPPPRASARHGREDGPDARAAAQAPETGSSIRVAADKLDKLVDLVGELVIVQAQISQMAGERHDTQMTLLAEALEHLSDELRDSTLGIRMLPIGSSFSRFRRLVRDLSAELGKEIGLATEGAETELDKTVIERLGDPLVHLLRNSIDHGIEPPDVREAAGKRREGTILLAAEHSGGEVLIRITDDGGGMNPEALRAKGLEKGIIPADAELSEKELFNLVFHPGFSTAAKITSVSGRGVGMDVVKRSIDSLRGSIEIDSRLGKGTSITIKLPLTLAIIDGLQVQVGEEFFVIPLALVEECVELVRDEADDDRQKIMHLRGEIVPYVHLREWFEVPGDRPPIEQIVITGISGSRVGIVVDHVIGEHQTVIKTLGRIYRDVEGVSGATIKGDGTMALILDVPRLVRTMIAAGV